MNKQNCPFKFPVINQNIFYSLFSVLSVALPPGRSPGLASDADRLECCQCLAGPADGIGPFVKQKGSAAFQVIGLRRPRTLTRRRGDIAPFS